MMDNPYRLHSSIGFSLLQLLLLTSLASPAPPPIIYQNVAIARLGTTVYFSMFQKRPFYLKLDCASIVLKIICDAFYVRYIITNYTYIFGVFDIFSDIIFFIIVMIALQNGGDWEDISKKIEEIRRVFIKCCCGWDVNGGSVAKDCENGGGSYRYTSLPSEARRGAGSGALLPEEEEEGAARPMYTYGGRQVFKPAFYSSSWGREYLNVKVEREFETIRGNNDGSATVTGNDGTEYIRFDEPSAAAGVDAAAAHYANIFVSPYFTKDGTPITAFSRVTTAACCRCNIDVLLFTYNLFQFIYQLMMYSNIMVTCAAYHRDLYYNNGTAGISAESMTRWLC
jgi:hypothetical protein